MSKRFVAENRGKSFRRPKGRVLYTVTGETVDNPAPFGPDKFVIVKRSSDGQEMRMTAIELRRMQEAQ